jgi:S-methylmethionine-dependent homocysteine/selenocysteine methylase
MESDTMAEITLLDGGMGQELIRRAGDRPTPIWSTQVMIDHPGLVEAVHRDYFDAGAGIATTNTYAIHRDRLVRAGIEDRFAALHAAALAEAHAARRQAGHGMIAGSIGPLVASYRPETHPPHAEAVAKYAEVTSLLAPHVDLILCETVASLAHARAILEGARAANLPVWLSVTVMDSDGSLLRSGEPTADAGQVAADMGAEAVLANCSAPEAMTAAMEALKPSGLPFGAYANGFEMITEDFLKDSPTVDALRARRDMGPDAYAAHALSWVAQGATIVGGCCETGPAHIAAVAAALCAAGHQVVR